MRLHSDYRQDINSQASVCILKLGTFIDRAEKQQLESRFHGKNLLGQTRNERGSVYLIFPGKSISAHRSRDIKARAQAEGPFP